MTKIILILIALFNFGCKTKETETQTVIGTIFSVEKDELMPGCYWANIMMESAGPFSGQSKLINLKIENFDKEKEELINKFLKKKVMITTEVNNPLSLNPLKAYNCNDSKITSIQEIK